MPQYFKIGISGKDGVLELRTDAQENHLGNFSKWTKYIDYRSSSSKSDLPRQVANIINDNYDKNNAYGQGIFFNVFIIHIVSKEREPEIEIFICNIVNRRNLAKYNDGNLHNLSFGITLSSSKISSTNMTVCNIKKDILDGIGYNAKINNTTNQYSLNYFPDPFPETEDLADVHIRKNREEEDSMTLIDDVIFV